MFKSGVRTVMGDEVTNIADVIKKKVEHIGRKFERWIDETFDEQE
jgi:hypothetical protein